MSYDFPDTEKKLKNRINSYKAAMNRELKEYGFIDDSYGKRYLMFGLHFALGDWKKIRAIS